MKSSNPFKNSLFALLALLFLAGPVSADSIRLEWQPDSAEFVGRGGYARVKKLSSGDLALVYSRDGEICFKKKTKGVWGAETIAAVPPKKNTHIYTNAELAELSDGRLFLTWNARPDKKDADKLPFKIMAAFSSDGGATWGAQRDLYLAGSAPRKGREGCWEPCPIQLPDGEVQVWFAYRTAEGRAHGFVLRSRDNAKTWLPPAVTHFRENYRNGMPVPVVLKDGTLVVAVEDNGFSGTPHKPVIIRPEPDFAKPVDANSTRRWGALSPRCELPPEIYAGAPYIIQLDSGETVLSVQSTEGRRPPSEGASGIKYSNLRVYVGDASAKNFDCPTTPFSKLPDGAAALWNSLCQIDHDTLLAVATINGLPEDKRPGVWLITAKIVRETSTQCKMSQIRN